jgi:hypothetical protein
VCARACVWFVKSVRVLLLLGHPVASQGFFSFLFFCSPDTVFVMTGEKCGKGVADTEPNSWGTMLDVRFVIKFFRKSAEKVFCIRQYCNLEF